MRLYPVFYIPDLTNKLLSMGTFLKKNKVVGDVDGLHIVSDTWKTMLSCEHLWETDTIYWAFSHIMKPDQLSMVTLFKANHQIWHRHLGHMSNNALKKMPLCVKGFPNWIVRRKDLLICTGCAEGKMRSRSFPECLSRAKELFELIHSDLKQLPVASYYKHKYFIVFLDDMPSVHWAICIKMKADVKKAIKEFIAYVKTQYNTSIKRWRIDAGGEFLNLDLMDMIKD